MDYVVERMRAAPADEIRVITRPAKADVVQNAERLGAAVIEGDPDDVARSIALGLDELSAHDVILIGFPDSIWEPADGYARLLTALDSGFEVALGLFSSDSPETCDVVHVDPSGRVLGVDHRPRRPTTNVIWGAAACRLGSLAGIADAGDPGVHFGRLCRTRPVGGVWLSHSYVDVGTPATRGRRRSSRSARPTSSPSSPRDGPTG